MSILISHRRKDQRAATPTRAEGRNRGKTQRTLTALLGGIVIASLSVPMSVSSQELEPGAVFRDKLKDGSQGPEMVVIPAGGFMMGSPKTEEGRDANEGPQREVTIGKFAMGKYEVTVGEFRTFTEATGHGTDTEKTDGCYWRAGEEWEKDTDRNWRQPGFSQGDDFPVVCVNWNDAVAYAQWLSEETGKPYRLPSEAEWEYAARAQTTTSRYWGDNPDEACRYANTADRTMKETYPYSDIHECTDGHVHTAPVGSFRANEFGLHDVLGNVVEWTQDCWNDNYRDAPTDSSARKSGDCALRVIRGGSWIYEPGPLRSAFRFMTSPADRGDFIGFRLAEDL